MIFGAVNSVDVNGSYPVNGSRIVHELTVVGFISSTPFASELLVFTGFPTGDETCIPAEHRTVELLAECRTTTLYTETKETDMPAESRDVEISPPRRKC